MKAIQRLYEYINYKGIKPKPFENKIGLSNGYLGKQLKRNADLGESILLRVLENCPDLNPVWLLLGNESMLKDTNSGNPVSEEPNITHNFSLKTDKTKSRQSIPLFDIQETTSVAALFRNQEQEKPVDYMTIPNLPKCDGAIKVSGDSMYPLIKAGDIILYKKVQTNINTIFWGEMYLVSILDEEGNEFNMIRWIQKSEKGEDYLKLVSENEKHEPKDLPIQFINGLAIIKASLRVNSMS
ncbi:S24 family peptidase [Flavobacterium phragmitis]|uniref:Phage repressor protein C, contains Cro/C1-type HTH and peptisase s24 domains n=1 Tax=Flavobacterium phragmitis TaxID=739143 RepID=A0A1I1PJH9_9FLAO|nr:LexA family transcriptional regulator [Flavobacterium phragmitis]SFD10009.1 Phage repressor protein C, contains Cro/C1-type HTH and peptisase s24 domains [Flavobacterium phragmitis]